MIVAHTAHFKFAWPARLTAAVSDVCEPAEKKASADTLNGDNDAASLRKPGKEEPKAPVKKEKKKKKKSVLLETNGDAAPDTGKVHGSNGKDQPKKDKQKKKRKKGDAEATEAAAPTSEQPSDPPKKKKENKQKSNGDASPTTAIPSAGPTGRASIGAADLASNCPQILKNTYIQHPAVTDMSEAAVRSFLEKREIVVEGCSLRPVQEFSQAGFPDNLMHALKTFKQPSPIQAQCWPIAMSGLDLIGIAATGSGAHPAASRECPAAAAAPHHPSRPRFPHHAPEFTSTLPRRSLPCMSIISPLCWQACPPASAARCCTLRSRAARL